MGGAVSEEAVPRCSYVHDVSDAGRFPDLNADEWECNHPATAGEYCVFHRAPEETDDTAVADALVRAVREGYEAVEVDPTDRFRFIGAEFRELDLPLFAELAADPAAPTTVRSDVSIDLREVTVRGAIDLTKATVRHDLLFDGATVGERLVLTGSTLKGELSLRGTRIEAGVDFEDATVDRLDLSRATIRGGDPEGDSTAIALGGRSATVDGDLQAAAAKIGGRTVLTEAAVGGDVTLRRSAFEDSVEFGSSSIGGDLRVDHSRIDENASFEGSVVEHRVVFSEVLVRGDVSFARGRVGEEAHRLEDDPLIRIEEIYAETLVLDRAQVSGDIGVLGPNGGCSVVLEEAHVEGGFGVLGAHPDRETDTVKTDDGYTFGVGSIRAPRATVEEGFGLKNARVEGEFVLREATVGWVLVSGHVEGSLVCSEATIEGPVEARGYYVLSDDWEERVGDSVNFADAVVEGDVDFDHFTIGRKAQFRDAVLEGEVSFDGTRFEGQGHGVPLNFDRATVDTLECVPEVDPSVPAVVSATHSTIRNGTLGQPADRAVAYDLTGATIGDVVIEDCHRAEDLELARIREAAFDGFDFAARRRALAATDWRLHTLTPACEDTLRRAEKWSEATTRANVVAGILERHSEVARRVAEDESIVEDLNDLVYALAGPVFEDGPAAATIATGRTPATADLGENVAIELEFGRRTVLPESNAEDEGPEDGYATDGDPDPGEGANGGDADPVEKTEGEDADSDTAPYYDRGLLVDPTDDEIAKTLYELGILGSVNDFLGKSFVLNPVSLSYDPDGILNANGRRQEFFAQIRNLEEPTRPELDHEHTRRMVVLAKLSNWRPLGETTNYHIDERIRKLARAIVNSDEVAKEAAYNDLRLAFADFLLAIDPITNVDKEHAGITTDARELTETYRKARNAAAAAGDSEAARAFHAHEMTFRRKDHFMRVLYGDGSRRDRIRALGRWSRNWVLNLTTGHGERATRPLYASLAIVGAFAAGYRYVWDSPLPSTAGWLEYLALSARNFLAFGLGEHPAVELDAIATPSTVEGILGLVFVLLFVITLSRSVRR